MFDLKQFCCMSLHTSKELNMTLLQLKNGQKCIVKPDNTRLQVF